MAAVELEASLIRAHPWDGTLVRCGWRSSRWFVEVPTGWRDDRARMRGAVDEILHIESRRMASAPGHALSYLVLGRTTARGSVVRAGAAPPWETVPLDTTWERSICWASADPADPECWVPLAPRQLTLLCLLRQADEATLTAGQFAEAAVGWFAIRGEQARAWYEGRHQILAALLEAGRPSAAWISGG